MTELATSLEVSKKLQEAGWTKPTYFGWEDIAIATLPNYQLKADTWHDLPAPTAQELLDSLPESVGVFRATEGYNAFHTRESTSIVYPGETATDALALCWLALEDAGATA